MWAEISTFMGKLQITCRIVGTYCEIKAVDEMFICVFLTTCITVGLLLIIVF